MCTESVQLSGKVNKCPWDVRTFTAATGHGSLNNIMWLILNIKTQLQFRMTKTQLLLVKFFENDASRNVSDDFTLIDKQSSFDTFSSKSKDDF